MILFILMMKFGARHRNGFGLGQLPHYGRALNAMEPVTTIMLGIVLTDRMLFAP